MTRTVPPPSGLGKRQSRAAATMLAGQTGDELMLHFEKVVCGYRNLGLSCAISVGWATIDADTEGTAGVLAAADHSMYEVKRARKARR